MRALQVSREETKPEAESLKREQSRGARPEVYHMAHQFDSKGNLRICGAAKHNVQLNICRAGFSFRLVCGYRIQKLTE